MSFEVSFWRLHFFFEVCIDLYGIEAEVGWFCE